MRSSAVKRSTRSEASTRAAVASWDRTTPLRSAVVPEVNRMKAGLSRRSAAGPSTSRAIHSNVNPSALDQARQPFTCTSLAMLARSGGVRLAAIGTRHAPVASRPNAAGRYAGSFGTSSPIRWPGRTPWPLRNVATRSTSRLRSA
jgi:hypothetical protein